MGGACRSLKKIKKYAKQESVYFAVCPSFLLNRDLECCPKQGWYFINFCFRPSAAPLHPNMGRVLPPAGGGISPPVVDVYEYATLVNGLFNGCFSNLGLLKTLYVT